MTAPRSGFSLVEVMVALSLVAVGATLGVRVMVAGDRSLDEAELGLRAVLLLSELASNPPSPEAAEIRTAGPGRLHGEAPEPGLLRVRYQPPGDVGPGGSAFHREHAWELTLIP